MANTRIKGPDVAVSVARFAVVAAFFLALPRVAAAQEPEVSYGGAGWMQFGRIEHSTGDPTDLNYYNKNWMQNAGGQLNVSTRFNANWDGGLGLGIVQVHLMRGREGNSNWYAFSVPYVAEARVTYSTSSLFTGEDKFRLSMGSVPYGYNPDAKNLGAYLMRGYVYPGALVSGFGNVFGAVASYEKGGLRNDLILNSEMDDRPLYDYSVADVVTYRALPGLELGAGVNLYRLLAQSSRFTSPGKDCPLGSYPNGSKGAESREPCYILYVDTAGSGGNPALYDTTTAMGSFSGVKLMGRFSADPKALFGLSGLGSLAFGNGDLKLYGEVAVIGVKDYPVYYDDIARRMPVMAGFNFPVFGFLDHLSLEVEYYASRNSSDNLAAQNGSWVPVLNPSVNTKRDDWKWSVNASKVLWGNMQLSAQVANDHLRPGGAHDEMTGVEATITPEDWYWTCKLAYFF